MRSITVACLIFVVTACGIPQIKESTLPKTSRVGVVSLLGNELEYRKRGLTIFSNKTEQIDVPDWQVDGFVVSRLHDNLKNRFEMVSVDHGKYDFSDGFTKNLVFFEAIFEPERVEDQIRAISDEYGLDALIIVDTYTAESSSAGYVDGYSILYRKRFGAPTLASFAIPMLHFVDCKYLKTVARWGTISFKDIERLPKHPAYAWYSADQKVKLKSWVEKVIAKSLDEVVADMKLDSLR